MREIIEAAGAITAIAILAIGGFILVLVTQPWFWLAVIAVILAVAFL